MKRRYSRRVRRRGTPKTLPRYVRDPLPDLRISLEYVDEVEFPNLEKALRRREFRFIRGLFGDVSIIAKPRRGGRTISVHHIVIDRKGGIAHYGVKGLRGWHGQNSNDILFYTRNGLNVEYDAVKDEFRVKKAKRK